MHKNEFLFRKIIALKYRGNSYTCITCNTGLNSFVPLPDDLLCPACGSRSRTRLLWKILEDDKLLKGSILEFSPPRIMYKKLKKETNVHYFPTDFENEFTADYRYNITSIDKEDESFDLIICFHILEHILDDSKAMSELYRVLKKDGQALIQTPFKEGSIYEDASILSNEDRLKAFGQEDHVRIYSLEGLKERLENTGFQVTIRNQEPIPSLGIRSETILIVRK